MIELVNTFDLPPTDEEKQRAADLSGFFFEKRWTVGDAKRAFALWYARVMNESRAGDFILESDLQDFARFVLQLNDSRSY